MTADFRSSIEAHRGRIDRRLADLLPESPTGQEILDSAIRDGALAPGKRLRPIIAVLTAEDLGGDGEAAMDAGCAVELVHAASLVLDDLPCMDDAFLRRGRPALHVSHGEDVAVLSAIAMLAGAYQILAGIETLSADARVKAVAVLSATVGLRGLVGGQFADLRGGKGARRVPDIALANSLKTGSLFSAAVEIGGVVAGVSDGTTRRLRVFAGELGHAFQLLDDLLDAGVSAAAIGKDVGQDAGKSTIVSILGEAAVERQIEIHLSAAHAMLTEIFGPRSRLHAMVDLIVEQAAGKRPVGSSDAGSGPPGRRLGAR